MSAPYENPAAALLYESFPGRRGSDDSCTVNDIHSQLNRTRVDPDSPDFLQRGVFSCYRPIDLDAAMPEDKRNYDPNELFLSDYRHYLAMFKDVL